MSQAEPRYPYVHVDVPSDAAELVSLELWELGAQGVEERDERTFTRPDQAGKTTLVASFAAEPEADQAVAALGERFPARVEFVVGDAWRDGWREHFKPTRVGQRLVVRPSWEPYAAAPDDVVMTLDPGGAFGTGTHESTSLVLGLLERIVTPQPVLDVGCGSGILSVAALLLGASEATAIDVDDAAVMTTRENAEINGVGARMHASGMSIEAVPGVFPLVLANIEAHILIPMAGPLSLHVAPAGALVLSGILTPQVDDVLRAYPSFTCEARPSAGEWTALLLRRSDAP